MNRRMKKAEERIRAQMNARRSVVVYCEDGCWFDGHPWAVGVHQYTREEVDALRSEPDADIYIIEYVKDWRGYPE